MTAKTTAQRAVLDLVRRVADEITTNDAIRSGMDAGELLKGCAAVLRAMDEVTVIDE